MPSTPRKRGPKVVVSPLVKQDRGLQSANSSALREEREEAGENAPRPPTSPASVCRERA